MPILVVSDPSRFPELSVIESIAGRSPIGEVMISSHLPSKDIVPVSYLNIPVACKDGCDR